MSLLEWARRRSAVAKWLTAAVIAAGMLTVHSRLSTYKAWRSALLAAGFFDELPTPSPADRILVVAPHPDDETLGCGGLIRRAVSRGAEVHVALMTNGDASELALIFGEKALPLSPRMYIKLGIQRQEESLKALAGLGVLPDHVHFLSFPNNSLVPMWRPEHWFWAHPFTSPTTAASASPYSRSFTAGASYCGEQVLHDLMALIRNIAPTAIFVTHPQDIHPDHWATAAFVQYAVQTLRVRADASVAHTRVYGYLIHWPHYPVPRRLVQAGVLLPPPDLREAANQKWLRLSLSASDGKAKVFAIRDYRTQAPSFDRLLLSFARTNEAFAVLKQFPLVPGETLEWPDEKSRRRALGSAEILDVGVTIHNDLTADAAIVSKGGRFRSSTYICLDLRTWDREGQPVIVNARIVGAGKAIAAELDSTGARQELVQTREIGPGRWQITGMKLPRASQALEHLFITCWGSVRDRVTDPAPPP